MNFTRQEIVDLIDAIETAEQELCYRPDEPERYPEAYAIAQRWMALKSRLELELAMRNQ